MEQPISIATGVPQLDLLLGGGVVQHSLLLIAGPAGSGKTVLAAQIAFAAAARGERVLFATAFSEPHTKLIANLRGFRFFNGGFIGESIKLLNLQHQLKTGTETAADALVREAREHRAQLVVLDGFQGIRVVSATTAEPHQFLYDLSAKLSLLGITTLITYDALLVSEATQPELTAVDAVVALSQDLMGEQATRMIQIIKNRGMNQVLGRHSLVIDETGITCYPRQESIIQVRDVAPGAERLKFGIPMLDTMLHGGVTQGTTTIIVGAEGVGKTLLSLHYLAEALAHGQHAVMVTFHETPQQLVTKSRHFGFDLQAALDQGTLIILHYPPVELNADQVAHALREHLATRQIQRLVIDGLNEIERPLMERGRGRGFFASLMTYLRSAGVTTCITQEIDPVIGRELSFVGKSLSALADNILLLRHSEAGEQQNHTLVVLKMRFNSHERAPHIYTIGATGLTVL